jgi:hypothetical protein
MNADGGPKLGGAGKISAELAESLVLPYSAFAPERLSKTIDTNIYLLDLVSHQCSTI